MKPSQLLTAATMLSLPALSLAKYCAGCDYGACYYNGGCINLDPARGRANPGCSPQLIGSTCHCDYSGADIHCCTSCPGT
nr:small secreted protein [Zymoseptoria tritici]WCS92244.1 small secreted protein [Zymoseptoria tritici]WCS92254.1 small secreted protein [Zymoseptoria tritici]WCS92272.1 small secreted protein [Zymoseptoria tritici]WCS92282.1 small secreted protein [Zymoseptoria tritici]